MWTSWPNESLERNQCKILGFTLQWNSYYLNSYEKFNLPWNIIRNRLSEKPRSGFLLLGVYIVYTVSRKFSTFHNLLYNSKSRDQVNNQLPNKHDSNWKAAEPGRPGGRGLGGRAVDEDETTSKILKLKTRSFYIDSYWFRPTTTT